MRPGARTQNVTKAKPVNLNFFTLDRNVGEFVTFSDSRKKGTMINISFSHFLLMLHDQQVTGHSKYSFELSYFLINQTYKVT